MKFELKNFEPIALASKDKFCTENILIVPHVPLLQTLNVVPAVSAQTVNYDSATYDGLKQVTVEAVPTETKTITANGEVTPSAGKFFSKVTVNVPSVKPTLTGTAVAGDVISGKTFYNTDSDTIVTGTMREYNGELR